MPAIPRSTLIVHGRLAMREARLSAARECEHGVQIMAFEQAAMRLAGGFAHPVDDESLRGTVQKIHLDRRLFLSEHDLFVRPLKWQPRLKLKHDRQASN